MLSSIESPFVVDGARNVFLETVKRGEYDSFEKVVDLGQVAIGTTSVILRLYEAYGGHAQARVLISRYLPVLKAFTVNLLEDEDEELYVLRSSDLSDGCIASGGDSDSALSLSFRGFEVKTVKLVLGVQPPKSSNKQV
jgi:alpha-mannosidase